MIKQYKIYSRQHNDINFPLHCLNFATKMERLICCQLYVGKVSY